MIHAFVHQGEGIQSFFGVNGHYDYVNTRTKLMEYDVYLYRLLERLFPCHNNYLKRCSRRGICQLLLLLLNIFRTKLAHEPHNSLLAKVRFVFLGRLCGERASS